MKTRTSFTIWSFGKICVFGFICFMKWFFYFILGHKIPKNILKNDILLEKLKNILENIYVWNIFYIV